MRLHNLLAGIALVGTTAAQFVFPDASSSLQVNQAIQIRWNTAGLQAPLSINLVPAGTVIRQDVVLQQVAVNIGNVGIVQWTADQTISAFPKFAMVIIDSRSRVVVSQPFVIQSLTRQPPQIDLGNGKGGNGSGNKQDGVKKEKDAKNDKNDGNNRGNKDGNKEGNKNNKNDKNENDNKNKDGNKDNKEDKENKNSNKDKNGNNDDKKENGKDNQQQEKATEKQEAENSATSLLPLPGLPASNAPPVSLQPLPTAASIPASSDSPAPAPGSAAPSPSSSSAAPAIPQEPSPAPESTSTASSTSEITKKADPTAVQSAPGGFTTLQPAAEPGPSPAQEAKAAAVPTGSQTADALLAIPGGSFREQTSEIAVPTSLPSQEDQETITTAITPRPGRFASGTMLIGPSDTESPSAVGGAKPAILSEGAAQRLGPCLALGLVGAVMGFALV